jgi:signal transduction histidine kinase
MHISIRQRIYWSFIILVGLFVAAGIITNITLYRNRKLSTRLTHVVDPSLQSMDELKKMLLESKMYTTNWVFFRYKEEDKQLLKNIHNAEYALLKSKISYYSSQWTSPRWIDSMNAVLKGFEQLLVIEKDIMASLSKFEDYDDPVLKFEAERKVEEDVLPYTAVLMNKLNSIYNRGLNLRAEQNAELEQSSLRLRIYIIVLGLATMAVGLFLAIYLTRIIIAPVKRMSQIVNDMGKGITQQIDYKANGDEIGQMVRSVNNLSDKLQATANFAHEVGRRNFAMPFKPLSEEDTLGKALISMRENLKKGEANLQSKNMELERKNKELEQFAYVASHDLQEPLRTISSFVGLFEQQYRGKLDDRADKYLTYIVQSSSRMKVLITDLLEYSRIGNKKELAQVDCNVILKEVVDDLNVAIGESNAHVTAGELPVITGYPTEIKQLFQNLIFNAIKFRKKDIAPWITVAAKRDGDYWKFEFADNGIGIAPEHHTRIFIIFQRLHTRNEYPGSGIGLSHCKKIVELHKGKIWLESETGQGTTFYFTIQYHNT